MNHQGTKTPRGGDDGTRSRGGQLGSHQPCFAVAFLQNAYFKDPERVRKSIEKFGDEYRSRLLTYALFAGCVTGRRIKSAFGQEAIDKIIWEESTREIAGDTKTIFPPDAGHIASVLLRYNPTMVITFGKIAYAAVKPLVNGRSLLQLPHPAARQPDTISRLAAGGKIFRESFNIPEWRVK